MKDKTPCKKCKFYTGEDRCWCNAVPDIREVWYIKGDCQLFKEKEQESDRKGHKNE